MNKKSWTKEQDEYILNNFGLLSYSDIAKFLECSIATVQNRALELGLNVQKKQVRRWTKEEIILLESMAPKYLNKTIAHKLNRTLNELNKKARELGIELIFKRPIWKKWKIKYLKENINKKSLRQIEQELDVNYYQIMDKLDELNIDYISDRWTEEEEQILKELSSKVYIREIAKVLNRTEGSIIRKAGRMHLDYITITRNFSEDERNYISNNWGKIPINEIARNLKASRMMVQKQADDMNLPKLVNNPYRKWTIEEVEKLQKLSQMKTITELAKIFNTTNTAIISLAHDKGIPLIDSKVHWTEEDNNKLRELSKTMDASEIALVMNRNVGSVSSQARRLHIKLIPNKEHINSVWTDENTIELKKLASQGKTILEIATIMHKNDQTVMKKAKQFNIDIVKGKTRPWTTKEVNKLKELAQTKNLQELVKEFNRTSNSIKSIAKANNIKLLPEKKNWTEEEYKLLEKLIMVDKKTPREAAQILGRTESSITIKIHRKNLQIQTNDKRHWTKEEEILLADLWGSVSIEKISKKLNRTASSIKNKAYLLGLGSYIENNYEGLTLKDICELLNVHFETVSVSWVSLGLKVKTKKITKSRSYRYVEIKDLFEFLSANQNIWDSCNLEENILGKEPEWLKTKRERDKKENFKRERTRVAKQQLILAKKILLELENEEKETIQENDKKDRPKLIKK